MVCRACEKLLLSLELSPTPSPPHGQVCMPEISQCFAEMTGQLGKPRHREVPRSISESVAEPTTWKPRGPDAEACAGLGHAGVRCSHLRSICCAQPHQCLLCFLRVSAPAQLPSLAPPQWYWEGTGAALTLPNMAQMT